MTFWIAIAIWALPSYLLHAAVHELAHYTIAWGNNLAVTRLHLFPPTRLPDGRFVFAYVVVPELGRASLRTRLAFFWAPLWAEALWWAVMGALLVTLRPTGVLAAILAVELVSPLVDSLWWLLGWWTDRQYTDAWQIRRMKDWSLARARTTSLLWLLPAALTTGLLLVVLF